MDIDNNKCLLAYAKMIKDKYENGELVHYLLPRIDNFITYNYGQLRGFIVFDKFKGKQIIWNCDGEDYYRLECGDSELNLDSLYELEKMDPNDLSIFEIDGFPDIEYDANYTILNYLLNYLDKYHGYITREYGKNENIFDLTYFMQQYLTESENYLHKPLLIKMSYDMETYQLNNGILVNVKYIPNEKIEFSDNTHKITIPLKKP